MTCPYCGQPLPHTDPLRAAGDELAERVRAAGHLVTADGRVREETAAELLDLAPSTLRNWRYLQDSRLRPVKVGRSRSYYLADIAALLVRE